jgi:succinate dehydrogenase / fumarate reductase, cytochrome b subunit
MTQQARPTWLNPLRIGLPVGACTSILHRVAGLCLVIVTPVCIGLLDLSLQGPQGFGQVHDLSGRAPIRFMLVFCVWALAYHLLADLRHLLTDVGIGSHLPQPRRSAWSVNGGAAVLALLCSGVWL